MPIGLIIKAIASLVLIALLITMTPYLLHQYSKNPEEQVIPLIIILVVTVIFGLAFWLPL